MGIEQMIQSASDTKERRRLYRETHNSNSYITKDDFKKLERKLDNSLNDQKSQQQQQARNIGQRAIHWIGTGFGNIAQSLNNPSDKRRPRIAQMPGRMSDMDIIRHPNLNLLKQANLRNRDIRGRKVGGLNLRRHK